MMFLSKNLFSLATKRNLASIFLFQAMLLTSGCGTTIAIGVGTEFNGSTIRENEVSCANPNTASCDAVQVGTNGPVGMIEIESPRWKGFSVEYQHVSVLERGVKEDPLDMVALKYTLTLGEQK